MNALLSKLCLQSQCKAFRCICSYIEITSSISMRLKTTLHQLPFKLRIQFQCYCNEQYYLIILGVLHLSLVGGMGGGGSGARRHPCHPPASRDSPNPNTEKRKHLNS